MKISGSNCLLIILLCFVAGVIQIDALNLTCTSRLSPCFLHPMPCPSECPTKSSANPKAKVCYVNCKSPVCQAECKHRRANCNSPGAACLDPRFIGGDGIVFYFHGKKDEHFSLVSDLNLQINARFIGLRPAGRMRDYTWIQALGILVDSHTFSLEATRASAWNDEIDHLKFSFAGKELSVAEGHLSAWNSPENDQIPSDDCFAHLEVQFRFFGLSSKVEGVLGRTYQPDFQNPAKPGVAMPVVGGEDKYRTTSLLSADCHSCLFSPAGVLDQKDTVTMEYGTLDCTGGATSGMGIVCRK